MIVEDLIMEKCLGKGAYGEVYLTRKKGTETKFATKRIDKRIANSEKYQKYFQNEREILKEIDHKNILKLIEIKENSRFYFLVKEYCNGGSLRDCLKRYQEEYDKSFSQEIIQHIMRQLVDVIKYLHSIDIIHRNIKLENILVIFNSEEDKNNLNMLKSTIKLNDFFFATRKTTSSHQTIIGSPYYMDPIILEIMKAKGKPCMNLGYDEKADIWSLGSIFYEMLIGKTVFNSDNLESLIKEAENGQYTLPLSTQKEILSFINGMLQYDSDDRLSAEELSKHEYLNKNVKDFKRIDISKLRSYIGKKGIIIDFKNHGGIYETYNTKSNDDDDINKINNNTNENIKYSLKNEENNIQSDSQNLNNNNSLKYSQYEVEEIDGDQRGNIEIVNRNISMNNSINPIQNNNTNNYNSGETDIKDKNINLNESCLSKDTNTLLENNLEKSIDSSKLLMRNIQDNQNNNIYNSNNFYTNDGIQNSINNNLNNNNYNQNSNNINIQGSNNYNMNNYNNSNNNQNSFNNNINVYQNDRNMMNSSNKMEENHGGEFMIASDNSEIGNSINNKNNMINNLNNNNMMNNSNNNMMNNSNNNNMMNNSNNNNMINNSNNNNMINNSNNNNMMNNSNNNNMMNNSNNNNMMNNSNNNNMINNSNNNMMNNSNNINIISNSNNNNMINNSNNYNIMNNSNNNNMINNSNNNMMNNSNNNNMMNNSNNNNMMNNSNNNNMINNTNNNNIMNNSNNNIMVNNSNNNNMINNSNNNNMMNNSNNNNMINNSNNNNMINNSNNNNMMNNSNNNSMMNNSNNYNILNNSNNNNIINNSNNILI